jgi:hypothetical protein
MPEGLIRETYLINHDITLQSLVQAFTSVTVTDFLSFYPHGELLLSAIDPYIDHAGIIYSNTLRPFPTAYFPIRSHPVYHTMQNNVCS